MRFTIGVRGDTFTKLNETEFIRYKREPSLDGSLFPTINFPLRWKTRFLIAKNHYIMDCERYLEFDFTTSGYYEEVLHSGG